MFKTWSHLPFFTTSRNCLICQKGWRQENMEAILSSGRKYHEKNKEERLRDSRIRRKKLKFKENRNTQRRNRYKNDTNYRIEQSIRARVLKFISGERKTISTKELLGASIDKTRSHLEKQFLDGMTWENHGEWHIDHIKPCSSFDLTDSKQQKECLHYLNLQPLWAIENIKKRDNTDYKV